MVPASQPGPEWIAAWRRDAEGSAPQLADPLPERRLARLLAAFIAAGLVFLVLPGTLLGVWNLIGISAGRRPESVSVAWIQSHGHAQLFGWVGTFILGISLYTLPKFRGAAIRSLAGGWWVFGLWTAGVAAHWASAVCDWHWRQAWPLSAAAELAAVLLLLWQCSAPSRSRRRPEVWERLVWAGLAGLAATLAWQMALLWPPLAAPLIPEAADRGLLWLALWGFCFPVAWGYSTRFLPSFLGLEKPRQRAANAGLVALASAAALAVAAHARLAAVPAAAAVMLAAASLRLFEPAARPAKRAGVDPRYPWFVRGAFAWLLVAAALALAGDSRGLTGASRHAFTVGFLGGLIFSIGPRILPSFLNSRELWSPRLMLASMALLAAGCALRVTAEPLAYAGALAAAWSLLPVSAFLELGAVLLFAANIAATLLSPMPAWIEAKTVHAELPLYWYVSAYPETRRLLAGAGLHTLARERSVPRSLTLRQAAADDGADPDALVALLRAYFERRLARTLRMKRA